MKSYAPMAFAAGIALGALGAATVTSWRRGAREGTYCVRCAMHRDTFGKRVRERPGALHGLLSPSAGEHQHAWADAVSARDADVRTLQREAAATELDDLDAIERDPIAIAALVEAWRDDRARAARFARMLIDPAAHVDRAALGLIQRPETPWSDRWRVVDGFVESYRCLGAQAAVTCSLPVGPVTIVAWHQVPGSVLRGPVPWTTWTPPGFVAAPRMTPIAPPAAPALPSRPSQPSPSGPLLQPIEPPLGPIDPPDEAEPIVAAGAPSTPGNARDVDRAIALAQQGQVEAAARELARLQCVTPQPAGLGRLRDAVRQRALTQIDDMILSGRCNDAQRFARQLRAMGLTVDAREHFGSACPMP